MAYRSTEKTRQKQQAAREALLKAAHRSVATQGFSATSIQQLAADAGLATGSVYRHFPSKADLFSEVFCRATEHEVAQVANALSTAGTPLQRIEFGIRQFAQRAIQGQQLAWSLIAEPVDPRVERDRLHYRHHYAQLFSAVLEDAIAGKDIPPQDTHIASAAIVGVISETLVGPLGQILQRAGHLHDTETPPNQDPAGEHYPQMLIDGIVRFCLQAVSGQHFDTAAPSPIDNTEN